MKPLLPLALFTLLATGSTAMASTKSLNEFPTGIMPVLVQVDAHGRVTDASPPTSLSPQLDRLLRKNLAEMVSKPATDRHGHPIVGSPDDALLHLVNGWVDGVWIGNQFVTKKPV